MTITYEVTIGREVREIRVEVPAHESRREIEDLQNFAKSTAWLERCGYLPAGVVNAVD